MSDTDVGRAWSPRSVLIVDDEVDLAEALAVALQRHGFVTDLVTTLTEARARAGDTDLLLLDLGLPDGDGLSACRELSGKVPVIVISARGDEVDRILALELGADDYLGKPFSTRELVARCGAVLRRAAGDGRSVVRVGDLTIDCEGLVVRRGAAEVELTGKEVAILVVLARHVGATVRRAQLASDVWSTDLGFVQRSIDVHISSLRNKLGAGPNDEGYIDTMHGVGYRLRR
ncbi:MAG: response regulator transcription factor [Ilumatobacteraceae bacterium]